MKLKNLILAVGIFMLSLSAFASNPEVSDPTPTQAYYLTYYIHDKQPSWAYEFDFKVVVDGTVMFSRRMSIYETPPMIFIGYSPNASFYASVSNVTGGARIDRYGAYPVNYNSTSGNGTTSASVSFTGLTRQESGIYIDFVE